MILLNGHYIDTENSKIQKKDMRISLGKIVEIEDKIEPEIGEKIIDIEGKYIFPGFFDMHAHFREPGYTHKETIETGSKAASKAGYTGVCIMPNTKPIIDNKETIIEIQDIIKRDSKIEIYIVGAITKSEEGIQINDLDEYKKLGIIAVSDDGVNVNSKDILKITMEKAKPIYMPILLHCEDMNYRDGIIHKGCVSDMFGFSGIPSFTEYNVIEENIDIAEKLKTSIHICHISTKESVDIIRKAKKRGVRVSCEVTPNHLILDERAFIKGKSNAKINPPLRSIEDRENLLEGIKDGTIDVIATDHAPHSEKEKSKEFKEAPFGMSSIEIAPQLIYSHFVKTGDITIFDMIRLMSDRPRELLGLSKIKNKVGDFANISVLDLENSFVVKEDEWVSKGKNTVFWNEELYGENYLTILNGDIVYRRNEDVCR